MHVASQPGSSCLHFTNIYECYLESTLWTSIEVTYKLSNRIYIDSCLTLTLTCVTLLMSIEWTLTVSQYILVSWISVQESIKIKQTNKQKREEYSIHYSC